jgi:hypothetical protein
MYYFSLQIPVQELQDDVAACSSRMHIIAPAGGATSMHLNSAESMDGSITTVDCALTNNHDILVID